MVDPLGAIDALVSLAGPFLIPVAIFVGGMVGYALLLALGRTGVIGGATGGRRAREEPSLDDDTGGRENS